MPQTTVSPTSVAAISVEQNFNPGCVTDDLLPPVVVRVLASIKESKSSAIFVGDCDGIVFFFTVKVSETDPDGVALRNLDHLNLADVVGIKFRVVERGEHTSSWQLSFR